MARASNMVRSPRSCASGARAIRSLSCRSQACSSPTNLSDLEPLLAFASHVTTVQVPLPSAGALESALRVLQERHPTTIPANVDLDVLAHSMVGVSIRTLEQLTKIRAYKTQVLQAHE